MIAAIDGLFNTTGGFLNCVIALCGAIAALLALKNVKSARGEIVEVKVSTNGRLDRLLNENTTFRQHIANTGVDPDSLLTNVSSESS